MFKRCFIVVLVCSVFTASAQESGLHADFRGEATRFHQSCGALSGKTIPGCAEVLFTDHPIHIAVGSIAPQNGFGAGAALVGHWTPNERWRNSWNLDALVSSNASWRAGGYLKFVHTPARNISISTAPGNPPNSNLRVRPYPVFSLYAQSISLNTLDFYGLGPNSVKANRSVFGMRETIVGANAVVPVLSALNLSLLAELNGRFIELRGEHNQSSPSIERQFTEAGAPGLMNQPAFIQAGEGIRLEPHLVNDHLQIDYLLRFQQYVAPSDSHYSFRRFTTDLNHTFPLYRNSGSYKAKNFNGPDECSATVGGRCPAIARNREGSISIRLAISESIASAGSVVPFYLQPTLGGSDINGNLWLGSYNDYRFRAPSNLLLREGIEHSIWGPIGVTFFADQGKVALRRDDIAFQHLSHSFSGGLTLRAGGLPALSLFFSWGGPEGVHSSATINTSLLGGAARPSLY